MTEIASFAIRSLYDRLDHAVKKGIDGGLGWRIQELTVGREVDFVMAHSRDEVDAVECKWNSAAFDGTALEVFRSYYPEGRNYRVFVLSRFRDSLMTAIFGQSSLRASRLARSATTRGYVRMPLLGFPADALP